MTTSCKHWKCCNANFERLSSDSWYPIRNREPCSIDFVDNAIYHTNNCVDWSFYHTDKTRESRTNRARYARPDTFPARYKALQVCNNTFECIYRAIHCTNNCVPVSNHDLDCNSKNCAQNICNNLQNRHQCVQYRNNNRQNCADNLCLSFYNWHNCLEYLHQ